MFSTARIFAVYNCNGQLQGYISETKEYNDSDLIAVKYSYESDQFCVNQKCFRDCKSISTLLKIIFSEREKIFLVTF